MSKKLLIETWLDPDPDDHITTHDLYCSALEAMERIKELEAENHELRRDIAFEQELRENYHNEETARLRDVLEYIKTNTSCSVARQWAKKALEVNTTVDDLAKELTKI